MNLKRHNNYMKSEDTKFAKYQKPRVVCKKIQFKHFLFDTFSHFEGLGAGETQMAAWVGSCHIPPQGGPCSWVG